MCGIKDGRVGSGPRQEGMERGWDSEISWWEKLEESRLMVVRVD